MTNKERGIIMKHCLKIMVFIFITVGIVFSGLVMADDSGDSEPRKTETQKPENDTPPRENQQFTDAQKATVASILSQYDQSSMTAEDAKAINDAFRAAGLRGGPGLKNAIEAAGYDPETITRLDPPPCGGKKGKRPRENRNDDRGAN